MPMRLPDADEVYAALLDEARRLDQEHGGHLVYDVRNVGPTSDDIAAFIQYMHLALVAIPVEPGEPTGPFFCIDHIQKERFGVTNIEGPDDGLTVTQGWLTTEWELPVATLAWMDRDWVDQETLRREYGHERYNSNLTYEPLYFDRLQVLLHRPNYVHDESRVPRVDEPATIAARDLPREKWDEMMASGKWAYPEKKGKLVTRRERNGRTGELSYQGTWKFIGARHPGVSAEDEGFWLSEYWCKMLGLGARRTFEQRRLASIRANQRFKVGDRVVYIGEENAIPGWVGVILSLEENVGDGLNYRVLWQGTNESLEHQNVLAPAPNVVTNPVTQQRRLVRKEARRLGRREAPR